MVKRSFRADLPVCLQKESPNSEFEVRWLQVISFDEKLTVNYLK